MDDRPSGRFGRYEILSELGRGAMGIVYKARDPRINRIVAVKTISLAGQPPEEEREYRERFFREAEAAGRLSHPGIVTVFDVGEEQGTRAPYIVMEYVGGRSLDKLLAQEGHRLPVETALQLAYELGEALDCAHAQGVVHRDLKPANILLTEDGHAKIADFGVAKLNLANTTLAGRALGTPAYMSPEQLNGEAVDGRSDLFSLGVVLYTMLTGHRPFQGNSAITVSFKVVNHDFVPATVLNAALPEGLDPIISRAMAKSPAERYQRGSEMLLDIQNLRKARELSSKETPGSIGGRSVPQTAREEARPSAPGQLVAPAKTVAISNPLLPRDAAAEKLIEKARNKSHLGVLILAGLFVLALWVISFGPQGVRPRAAGPSPHAINVTAKRAAPMAPSAGDVGTATAPETRTTNTVEPATPLSNPKVPPTIKGARPAATPVSSEKISKSVPAVRIYPALAKRDHALPSTITPPGSTGTSPTASMPISPTTLEIEVEHQFAAASLTIWVDDRLTYTHRLEGTDKKRLIVFHRVQGHEFHAMQVSPGKHRLRVQVTSDMAVAPDTENPTEFAGVSRTYDQSGTVDGDFASGQENILHISFKKNREMKLSLQ